MSINREDALNYHSQGQPGKIEVVPTKLLSSQLDLALAYSPGVAEPCKEIAANPDDVYKYTAKGNLVAVITNGTAVLGLGNIGPAAAKPVMEGKGVLFKKFSGIDVFDIEINSTDPDDFIRIVESLEPTFGGINLEDIKAPECFKIEEELRKRMNIPVMHDDQHGTAIISSAALLNALEVVGKSIAEVRITISGAGAAAISCTRLYHSLGARKGNIVMVDIDGVIRKDRQGMPEAQMEFATDRDLHQLSDAIKGSDVFIGLSAGGVLKAEMLTSMAVNPIVFAMANPTPEIDYNLAIATRPDVIMATGRSDYPNQVNNVLGFPFIFRGALDVRATEINEAMKLAAVKAIAELAKEPVPDIVNKAYGDNTITFGRTYLIPKPLDPRLITSISPAVAKAAIDSGVAKKPITNWEQYDIELQQRIGIDQKLMTRMITQAKGHPKRVVFAEADHPKILKAVQVIVNERIAVPVLLGDAKKIAEVAEAIGVNIKGIEILDPNKAEERIQHYAEVFFKKRQRKGITLSEAIEIMRNRDYFAAAMVETGDADAFISGLTHDYAESIKPALQLIGSQKDIRRIAGMYIMINKKGTFFFSDVTMNENPTAEELVEIVAQTAKTVRFLGFEPKIAMLSYTNFGSSKGEVPNKVAKATELAKRRYPDLIIEGDIQANVALDTALQQEMYPFSALAQEGANTFIFPDLASGNIAYKLLQEIGGTEAIGPLLLGMEKPVHILQMGSSVREIVNMTAVAVVQAADMSKNIKP
ncbi:MAG: NADP-dependent malic enzyme [Cytophagaceae bacterium]|nr:NADP-dependent malic enzyme [Cytophagaceae bacterium]